MTPHKTFTGKKAVKPVFLYTSFHFETIRFSKHNMILKKTKYLEISK